MTKYLFLSPSLDHAVVVANTLHAKELCVGPHIPDQHDPPQVGHGPYLSALTGVPADAVTLAEGLLLADEAQALATAYPPVASRLQGTTALQALAEMGIRSSVEPSWAWLCRTGGHQVDGGVVIKCRRCHSTNGTEVGIATLVNMIGHKRCAGPDEATLLASLPIVAKAIQRGHHNKAASMLLQLVSEYGHITDVSSTHAQDMLKALDGYPIAGVGGTWENIKLTVRLAAAAGKREEARQTARQAYAQAVVEAQRFVNDNPNVPVRCEKCRVDLSGAKVKQYRLRLVGNRKSSPLCAACYSEACASSDNGCPQYDVEANRQQAEYDKYPTDKTAMRSR